MAKKERESIINSIIEGIQEKKAKALLWLILQV